MIDTIDEVLELAAGRLAIDLDAGYTEGYERTLALEVHQQIPAEKRPEILRWLIHGLVADITTGGVSLLDETTEDTYQLADEITGKLAEAVRRQGHADRKLLHLLAYEIAGRERVNRILRQIIA